MAVGAAEELQASGNKTSANLLKHVPQEGVIAKNDLIETCKQNGIGRDRAYKLIGEMLGKALFEFKVRREGKCPTVYLSRQPAATDDGNLKDSTGCYMKLPVLVSGGIQTELAAA
jgi:hypothetical protein